MSVSEKLAFAVIGCGRMGLRRAKSIVDHPDTDLVCVADINEEKARGTAKDLGVGWSGIEEAFRRTDVDCIVVSVPNKSHPSLVVSALGEGKHVWCEKPLARNPDEAWQMVNAAAKSKAFLKTGANLRYFPNVQKARELLDKRAIGDVLFIRGWIGNAGWQLKSWYSDFDMMGGGAFLDNGSHLLDIYRWFLGEATECTGYSVTAHWQISPLEDNAMGVFKFSGGKLAFLQSSWTEWAEYMYMEVYGSQGYLRVDSRQEACLALLGKKDGSREIFDFSKEPPQSYKLEFDDFVQSIKERRQPLPSGFDGLRAVQMAHGVYESARSGRSVPLWGERENRILEAHQKPTGV